MKNKTKDLIIRILKENIEMDIYDITRRLERNRCSLTYNAISKNLCEMFKEGTLTRQTKYNPWRYYYKLNEGIKK